ncbi:MAG: FlgO family outer membrane protein [bacterium]
MRNIKIAAGVFIALLLTSSPLCAANGFKAMAKELSRAAGSAGIERVAVLPFVAADGSSAKDGWNISEKLITQVVRVGQVQAVERSLLRNVMEEHHLAQTGMIDPNMLKKIGKVFSVEGIVTGSFVTLDEKVVVNARLINVETGVIIAAVERQADREWFDATGSDRSDSRLASLWVPVPEFTVEALSLPPEVSSELRDAPTDNSCEGASERVDRMESRILDIKARYWADQLKKGASLAGLKANPGSTISDPSLKKAFYDRMKYWYGLENVPALTPSELQRFFSIDGKAYSLYRECAV